MSKILPRKLLFLFDHGQAFASKTAPLTTYDNGRFVFMISDPRHGGRYLAIVDSLTDEKSIFDLDLSFGEITDIPLAIYVLNLDTIMIISAHFQEKCLHIEYVSIDHESHVAKGLDSDEYYIPWIYSGYTYYDLYDNFFIISNGQSMERIKLFKEGTLLLDTDINVLNSIINKLRQITEVPPGRRFLLSNNYIHVLFCSRQSMILNCIYKFNVDSKRKFHLYKENLKIDCRTQYKLDIINKARFQMNDYKQDPKNNLLWILSRYTLPRDSLRYKIIRCLRFVLELLMIFNWFAKIGRFFLHLLIDEYSFALFCLNLTTFELKLVEDFSNYNFYSSPYYQPSYGISLLNVDEDGNAILYKKHKHDSGAVYSIQNPFYPPRLQTISRNTALTYTKLRDCKTLNYNELKSTINTSSTRENS